MTTYDTHCGERPIAKGFGVKVFFMVESSRLLVVLDVDSTLIQEEVIELLAECAGKRSQVEEITERAMSGELDFEASLKARVKLLEGLPESVVTDSLQRCHSSNGAEELIAKVHSAGGKVGAVSGGFIQLLEPLAKQLGLDFYRANVLEIVDGTLTGNVIGTIIDKPAKATALIEWAQQSGVEMKYTVAIGDGANDLDMMQAAGLSIGFNPKPRVRKAADIILGTDNLRDAIPLLGI